MIGTSRQLKDKIRNLAALKSAHGQILMRTFMTERFLERVSQSEYRDKLILKGGTLVTAMVGVEARSTMDLDVTIKGVHVTEEKILAMITEIVSIPLDDHVHFAILNTSSIMDDADYHGFRISMEARFDGTITPLKQTGCAEHADA